MATKKSRITKTISITMSPALYEKMESEAENLGMNRSAFISLALNQYFKSTEALLAVEKLREAMLQAQALKDESQINLFELQGEKS